MLKSTRTTIATLTVVGALVVLTACQPNNNPIAADLSSAPNQPQAVAPTTVTSSPPASVTTAVCTQPCGTANGLTLEVVGGDGTVYSSQDDGHPEYQAGGIQVNVRITNASTRDASLLPGYFAVIDGARHKVVASVGAYVRSASDPAGHDCDWNAPILAPGGSVGPVPICFTVPPPQQSGTLSLVYNDGTNPAIDVPFTLNGTAPASTTQPPSPTPSPLSAAGGQASGQYAGTESGLTVSFASDGSHINGFNAHGGWTCGNGYSVMSFQLPSSPVIGADGTFNESASSTISGSRLTWELHGKLAGRSASGTLQVQSSLACELYSTPWAAST
jgi:hypothetical protein